jgi:hypothetical protein
MSKKSDDSIERIFRQALTQYDTSFRENDWLKMEKMLNDEADRRAAIRSKRIKGTAFTLTGLTGLIIAVYFLAFKNPSGSIARLNDSVSETQAAGDLRKNGDVKDEDSSAGLLSEGLPQNSTDGKKEIGKVESSDEPRVVAPKSSIEGAPVEKNGSAETAEALDGSPVPLQEKLTTIKKGPSEYDPSNSADPGTAKEINPQQHALTQESSKGEPNTNTTSDIGQDSIATIKETRKVDPTRETFITHEDELTKDAPSVTQSDKITKGNGSQLPDAKAGVINSDSIQRTTNPLSPGNLGPEFRSPENLTARNAVAQDTLSPEELNVSGKTDSLKNNSSPDAEKKNKIKPASRWSIGVVLAPEFSTTSLSRYSTPGESVGLRIGYQISNRFTINTGFIRSTKKYKGEGYDYSPRNPAYWQLRTNGVIPEEIDSRCLVYELPLDIQFDAIQTQKSRVFVSTSISSYFMMSQAYDYTFESPNPGADTGWRSPGSESYWFSVGMVSAGYERYIHRSLAIGIEPYLKISLSEIGWPNVKLFSTGAYVTLRYKFVSKK